MNRWSKSGVLQRIFQALQEENIIRIKVEAVCLDSTSIKVHPNGTGALKKAENRLLDDQEEDLQRRFIWLPQLTERLFVSRCQQDKLTMRRKEKRCLGKSTEKLNKNTF